MSVCKGTFGVIFCKACGPAKHGPRTLNKFSVLFYWSLKPSYMFHVSELYSSATKLPVLNKTITSSNRTLDNDNNLLLSTPFNEVKLIYKLKV